MPQKFDEIIKVEFDYDEEGKRVRTIIEGFESKLKRVIDYSHPNQTMDTIFKGNIAYVLEEKTGLYEDHNGIKLKDGSVIGSKGIVDKLEKGADFLSKEIKAHDNLRRYMNSMRHKKDDDNCQSFLKMSQKILFISTKI